MGSGLGVSSASSRDSLSRSSMGDRYGRRGGEQTRFSAGWPQGSEPMEERAWLQEDVTKCRDTCP